MIVDADDVGDVKGTSLSVEEPFDGGTVPLSRVVTNDCDAVDIGRRPQRHVPI